MFIRLLFLLLLVLNLGVAGWIFALPQARAPAAEAGGGGVPRLELLSERDRDIEASSAELATAPDTAADIGSDTCKSIGPFATQADQRAAITAVTPLVNRIRPRETRATQARGWWVYLPAFPTRERALTAARALSAKGMRDYYIVTAGDQQNTISLGLFRDQLNAERRRAEITALGLKPQMTARTEEMPQYWIDYATRDELPIAWRPRIDGAPELREEPIDCF